ncbi:MAG: septation protein IspZ, partial [Candidatus Puniceispirillaceae bacterium]
MKMRLVSMAGEILPLAGLFIGNALADIFIGALAAVCLAAGVVLYNRVAEQRWANFAVFSVIVSAVFAFAALVTEDSLFIKIQPTLFNAMFSALLLGGWL